MRSDVLFAILVLRQSFKTDNGGIAALLDDLPDLRHALGLTKAPHYPTLCYAEKRLVQGRLPGSSIDGAS